MYDTFHANIEEKGDRRSDPHRRAAYTVHVHISENDRSTPGQGHVAWAENFDALKKSATTAGWWSRLLASPCPRWPPPPRSGGGCIESEEQLARDALAFMKKHTGA